MLNGFKNASQGFFREALFQIAPPAAVFLANRRTQNPSGERTASWMTLPRETLLKIISEEWERAKSLDEKLTKTTAALSIAGAVGGVSSRSLLEGLLVSPMRTVVIVCLLISIVSLFSGIVMGFAGLRPKPRGGVGPDFAVRTQSDGRASKVACVEALASFEVTNIRRANEAAGANASIRNGVLAFVIATLVTMFAPRAPEKSPMSGSTDKISVSLIANQSASIAGPSSASVCDRQCSCGTDAKDATGMVR